jgi:hypothetical protein
MKLKATEHRPQVSLMEAVMERKNLEDMTTDEWIEHRRQKLEAYHASGKELKPSPECKFCDTHNDYVCFYCETFQLGESK